MSRPNKAILAKISFILSVLIYPFALFYPRYFVILSMAAIICGHISIFRTQFREKIYAFVGLAIGYFFTMIWIGQQIVLKLVFDQPIP